MMQAFLEYPLEIRTVRCVSGRRNISCKKTPPGPALIDGVRSGNHQRYHQLAGGDQRSLLLAV